MNLIHVDFTPEYMATVADHVRTFGLKRTENILVGTGLRKSFVKAALKRIMRRNAW